MSLSNDDFSRIMLPQHVKDNFDKNGGWDILCEISDQWFDFADNEIESGKSGEPHIYYLRMLRIADSFYSFIDSYGVTEPTFFDIIAQAFDYCGFAVSYHEVYKRQEIFRIAFQNRWIETVYSNQARDPLLRLTFEGIRVLNDAFGDVQIPEISKIDSDEIDEVENDECENGKAKNRVSIDFKDSMRTAVIELSSERDDKITASDVYARMQKNGMAETVPFNRSDISHGKRELQNAPYSLVFIEKTYRLTPDCLAQQKNNNSPTGKHSKSNRVGNSNKFK